MKTQAPKLTARQKAQILGDDLAIQVAHRLRRQGHSYGQIAKRLNSRKDITAEGMPRAARPANVFLGRLQQALAKHGVTISS